MQDFDIVSCRVFRRPYFSLLEDGVGVRAMVMVGAMGGGAGRHPL